MKQLARILVVLAVAGHMALSVSDVYAQAAGGTGGTGGTGGAAGGNGGGAGAAGAGGTGAGAGMFNMTTPGVNQGHPTPPPPVYQGSPNTSGACGVLQLSDPNAGASPIAGVAKITEETQRYIETCGCATKTCIADALDKYAAALKKVAPRLPPAFRKLPQIVAAAAQRARSAPTLKAAVKVLRAAVAVVHKTIELARPSDPDEAAVARRGGDLVGSTLNAAANTLERAETL